MRLRHNKKRNTAFVYEALVRELTKAVIKNKSNQKNKVASILKEHFSKDSTLHKELELYKSLCETKGLQKDTAEKLIIESKIQYSKIDKKVLFKEQSHLIKKINKILSPDVFNNFVPSYKNLASIYSIFNDAVSVKEKILLENKIVENMVIDREGINNLKDPIDNLVYKTFVSKFNDKYSSLKEGQKVLLTKYVTSFVDDGLELKIHLNEVVGELKEKVSKIVSSEMSSSDQEISIKSQEVLNKLDSYLHREIDENMLEEILKIQNLTEEFEKDVS